MIIISCQKKNMCSTTGAGQQKAASQLFVDQSFWLTDVLFLIGVLCNLYRKLVTGNRYFTLRPSIVLLAEIWTINRERMSAQRLSGWIMQLQVHGERTGTFLRDSPYLHSAFIILIVCINRDVADTDSFRFLSYLL